MNTPKETFGDKVLANLYKTDKINTQSIIVYFMYGYENDDPFYYLVEKLSAFIDKNNLGFYDGHEMAWDNSYGVLYMYTPSAEKLFKKIKPIFEKTPFMNKAQVFLQFDQSNEESKENIVVIEADIPH